MVAQALGKSHDIIGRIVTTNDKFVAEYLDEHADTIIKWRCFHCNEGFTELQKAHAEQHFGYSESAKPVCLMRDVIDKPVAAEYTLLKALRRAEEELINWRSETMPILNSIDAMAAAFARNITEAEQKGYDKAVNDMAGIVNSPTPPDHVKL